MWYVVYRNPFKSNRLYSDGGYFVKYKNKIEDEYSTNIVEANKYKSIGPALSRLGIYVEKNMFTLESVFERTQISFSEKREIKLNKILDIDFDPMSIFHNNRIDKIDIDGKYIGCSNKEAIDYIQSILDKNKRKFEKIKSEYEEALRKTDPGVNYICDDFDFDELIGIK